MVFDGEEHQLHACGRRGAGPLVGVEGFTRIEHGGIFLAAAPFVAREGVEAEVGEAGELELVIRELCGRRHEVGGLGHDRIAAFARGDRHAVDDPLGGGRGLRMGGAGEDVQGGAEERQEAWIHTKEKLKQWT